MHVCLRNIGHMRIKLAFRDNPHGRQCWSQSLYIRNAISWLVEVRIWGELSTTLYELILSPSPPFDLRSFELLKLKTSSPTVKLSISNIYELQVLTQQVKLIDYSVFLCKQANQLTHDLNLFSVTELQCPSKCDPDAECVKYVAGWRCACNAGFKGNGITCQRKFGILLLYCIMKPRSSDTRLIRTSFI